MSSCVPWQPTYFERWEECDKGSSTGVARVRTDAGIAYIKTLGNKEGPHALAREWIGTSLARWFGLPTFDYAIFEIEPGCDIPLGGGRKALAGPAFAARFERGRSWGGTAKDLKLLDNPEVITPLVVFDTLVLNADRQPPPGHAKRNPNRENVYFSERDATKGHYRLVAMDFSDCLKVRSELTPHLADIDHVQDERIYGLFPEFRPWLRRDEFRSALAKLARLSRRSLDPILGAVPREWEVDGAAREAVTSFLTGRARFLERHLPEALKYDFAEQTEL